MSRKPKPAPAAPAPALPEFTLEGLQQQRARLQAQHNQAVANVNAVSGAMQFCDQMIAQLSAPAGEKK